MGTRSSQLDRFTSRYSSRQSLIVLCCASPLPRWSSSSTTPLFRFRARLLEVIVVGQHATPKSQNDLDSFSARPGAMAAQNCASSEFASPCDSRLTTPLLPFAL